MMKISSIDWLKTGLLLLLAITVIVTQFVWKRFHADYWLALPLLLLFAFQLIYNYRPVYYLLFLSIPASLHIEIGSFAIDTSEPLMLISLGLVLIQILSGKQFELKQKISPFFVFIFLLLFWAVITTITSVDFIRSLKFLLAKIWYVAAFVFLADKVIESEREIKIVFWCFLIPLVIFSIHTTGKHIFLYNLTFDGGFRAPYPFFTNHVIYGCILTQFLPFVWNARYWYDIGSIARLFLNFSLIVLGIGVILTFGRMAWACGLLLPFIAFAIRTKLFDKGVYIGIVIAIVGVFYLVSNNNFYRFAPDYKKTIFHEGDLNQHLNATLNGTDLSGMERFYRWVAAKNMVEASPVFGFGPSCFNQVYKKYADEAFITYVSDNEEQSTTHNYFLMTTSEQGFIGLFLFVGMFIFMLLSGYYLYHKAQIPIHKNIVMSATLCLTIILLHSTLNELIEVDKVGSMFWFSMFLIYKIGEKERILKSV